MNLILTLDYELYGDGSGDVFRHMIEPTNRILDICDTYNIKTTIFFEVIEYLKLKEEWDKGNTMGYENNPIRAIEKQLQEAVLNGHDIQLHIHPQWVKAEYKNNHWFMDFSNWRLGDFRIEESYSIEDMLKEGKDTIENLIREVVPEYKCIALRAGGYNIMPSEKVYKAMKNLGLKIDSSVYPGGYEVGDLSQYDYRDADLEKDFWRVVPDNFAQLTLKSSVLEIPVFALKQKRFKKFNLERIKSAFQNRNSVIGAVKAKTIHKSKIEKIKYFFEKEAFTWDFCLFDFRLHKVFFNYIEKNLNRRQHFVIIGHPKSFTSDKSFKKMIMYAQKEDFQFKTLSESYAVFHK